MTLDLSNRPLALADDELSALRVRWSALDPAAMPAAGPIVGLAAAAEAGRQYEIVGGVALICVAGLLFPSTGFPCAVDHWWYGWMTGYDAIRDQLRQAMADAEVRAVALVIDSPGGTVAGCFDLADAIFAARDVKPLWAVLNDNACSAAYALASACSRVIVPRTGVAGSVGVIQERVDMTAALASFGVAITLFTSGDRKGDGSPVKPLSDGEKAATQSLIDEFAGMFFDLVARHRGLAADAVRALQAGIYIGASAVTIGLADEVLPSDAAVSALIQSVSNTGA